MISYLEQVPELWKLNDFFVECVSDYLQIKREYETVPKNLSKNIPYVVILCLLNERYL